MAYQTIIDSASLERHRSDPDWRMFDCRFDLGNTRAGEEAYNHSHIPGAFYAHLDRDLSSPIRPDTGRHPLPDVTRLSAWLGEHGIEPSVQVVVYDDSGGAMAVRLWWLLRWLGHDRVALLDGGWKAWLTAALPIDAHRVQKPDATRFDGTPNPSYLVTTEQIEAQLQRQDNTLLLVDARAPERFRGESEPIDPIAGHVPGAVNLPLQQNLDERGHFKPADELRRLHLQTLGGYDASSVALMCGSGVTACHNLLAMEIASLRGGRLYAGSWSEWIRDPARPIARDK